MAYWLSQVITPPPPKKNIHYLVRDLVINLLWNILDSFMINKEEL